MKLKIEQEESNWFTVSDADYILAEFFGPMAKTMAETFVRAMEAGVQ